MSAAGEHAGGSGVRELLTRSNVSPRRPSEDRGEDRGGREKEIAAFGNKNFFFAAISVVTGFSTDAALVFFPTPLPVSDAPSTRDRNTVP